MSTSPGRQGRSNPIVQEMPELVACPLIRRPSARASGFLVREVPCGRCGRLGGSGPDHRRDGITVLPMLRARRRSGKERDPSVGGQQDIRGGPAVEDADDLASSPPNEPAWRMKDRPAQRLRARESEVAVQAAELEPAHEDRRRTDAEGPVLVRLEVRERKARQARGLESRDVLLDVRVGAHAAVEGDGVAGPVGVEAPLAVLGRGEEALRERAESMEPDVGEDAGPAEFHDNRTRAGRFHLRSGPSCGVGRCFDNTGLPRKGGSFRGYAPAQLMRWRG